MITTYQYNYITCARLTKLPIIETGTRVNSFVNAAIVAEDKKQIITV